MEARTRQLEDRRCRIQSCEQALREQDTKRTSIAGSLQTELDDIQDFIQPIFEDQPHLKPHSERLQQRIAINSEIETTLQQVNHRRDLLIKQLESERTAGSASTPTNAETTNAATVAANRTTPAV